MNRDSDTVAARKARSRASSLEALSLSEAVVDQMAAAYYLDDRLSLAESTCTFPANGLGRENVREEFYVVAIRERGSDGVADTKAVYATLAGPVNQLMLSGSGLGDAAVAFEQGSGSFAQIAGAVVDVAPDTFAVNTPLVWVRSRLVPISWAPAPNAIGPVTYTVTVDDTDVADGLTRTSINLGPGDISDGTHTLAVIATDEQGQSVTSLTNTVQVDRTPPRATIRVSGRRATVRVFDATSGLAAASVGFGDGAHGGAHARHTYRAPGHYVITIRARDRAGNRAVIRRRVRIR